MPYLENNKYGIMITAHAICGVIHVTKSQDQGAFEVTFYTKAGCHLCEEARDMLEDIAALTTYELTEIDIRSNPTIFEQYRYRIPVILINNETLIEGRIEFRDLAKAFHLR
jgi:glutaredoxin